MAVKRGWGDSHHHYYHQSGAEGPWPPPRSVVPGWQGPTRASLCVAQAVGCMLGGVRFQVRSELPPPLQTGGKNRVSSPPPDPLRPPPPRPNAEVRFRPSYCHHPSAFASTLPLACAVPPNAVAFFPRLSLRCRCSPPPPERAPAKPARI